MNYELINPETRDVLESHVELSDALESLARHEQRPLLRKFNAEDVPNPEEYARSLVADIEDRAWYFEWVGDRATASRLHGLAVKIGFALNRLVIGGQA